MIISILICSVFGNFRYDAPQGGTLIVCLKAEPPHLNGALVYNVAAIDICQSIYSSVVIQDYGILVGLESYGDLAERWAVSSDGLTYTFHLREDIKWHDGNPFTSADVLYTWNTVIENNYPLAVMFTDAESITAPDDYTVVVKLTKINAAFISTLATTSNWYGFILPKHLYEGTDWSTNPYNMEPVGTGPFKFEEWVQGDYLSLVANEDWRGTRISNPNGPFIDKLIFKFIPDATVARAALEAGEVDYIDSYQAPPFGELESFDAKPGIKMVAQDSIYSRDLMFCWGRAPWDDLRVRQAVAYAIDKEELCSIGFADWYEPLNYVGCPGTPKWNNYDATFPQKNLEMAEQLLDDAGYPRQSNGIRFSTTLTDPGWAETKIAAEIIVEQLKEVGIDVTWEIYDYATWYSKVAVNHDFDLTIGYIRYGPDPDTYREHFGTLGFRNLMNYSNPEVDELLQNGVSTMDWDERLGYYMEAARIIAEDVPYTPLVGSPYYNFVGENWYGIHWEPETYGHTFGWYGWCTAYYEEPKVQIIGDEVLAPWAMYTIVGLVVVIAIEAIGIVYVHKRKK